MPFEWFQGKAERNLKDHDVSFDEAKTAFDDEMQVHRKDTPHSLGEKRYICLGMSNKGRLLMVWYTERSHDVTRIIGARVADKKERKFYESENYQS